MWIRMGDQMFNLALYHKAQKGINDRHNMNRIFFDIRAGGTQEGNGREMIDLEDMEQRDEVFELISAFLASGAPIFDIPSYLAELEEQLEESQRDRVPSDSE